MTGTLLQSIHKLTTNFRQFVNCFQTILGWKQKLLKKKIERKYLSIFIFLRYAETWMSGFAKYAVDANLFLPTRVLNSKAYGVQGCSPGGGRRIFFQFFFSLNHLTILKIVCFSISQFVKKFVRFSPFTNSLKFSDNFKLTNWNRHFTNYLKCSDILQIAWYDKLTLTYICSEKDKMLWVSRTSYGVYMFRKG